MTDEEVDEVLTITWPSPEVDMFTGCAATTVQTITFMGANALPEEWADIDLESNTLTIDSALEALKALTKDVLIIASVHQSLIETSTAEVLSTAQIDFAVRLETRYIESSSSGSNSSSKSADACSNGSDDCEGDS